MPTEVTEAVEPRSLAIEPIAKRGRGRPKGSKNKRPKPLPPSMTAEQREELKQHLAASYAEALVSRTLAGVRAKRLKATIRANLGREGLAAIEAEIAMPRAEAERPDAA